MSIAWFKRSQFTNAWTPSNGLFVLRKKSASVVSSKNSDKSQGVRKLTQNPLVQSAFTCLKIDFYTRYTIVARYYGFTVDVRVSIRPSVSRPSVRISFPDDNLSKHHGFSPNLVCALILWRSGLGLLMGKFRQILTELSARDTPIYSFPDDNM